LRGPSLSAASALGNRIPAFLMCGSERLIGFLEKRGYSFAVPGFRQVTVTLVSLNSLPSASAKLSIKALLPL
jgi:hypothetical protein